jgi:hypothetical protein
MADGVDRFRALVMTDAALQDALSRIEDLERFVECAVRCAGTGGVPITSEAVHAAVRPDPVGLSRWEAAPVSRSHWPPVQWVPIHVSRQGNQLGIDWAHFGGLRLTDPFFESSIRRALARPFNRMFRFRVALGDFLDDFRDGARREEMLAPSGFIFHMSRCGSTLIAQMLAALPHHVVVSEAPPLDAVVQLTHAWRDGADDRHARLLAAMIGAFGRRRHGDERRLFVKLDSWHTLALPLFLRAFPSVPWVFVYRDPVEVLVSQMRERGMQTVPGMLPPGLSGLAYTEGMSGAEYCARVLETICRAVLDAHGNGHGLLVNYRDLPEAVWTTLLPHFGVASADDDRRVMADAARVDAKRPGLPFTSDTEDKQREATELIRTMAERHLGDVYRHLELLRSAAV